MVPHSVEVGLAVPQPLPGRWRTDAPGGLEGGAEGAWSSGEVADKLRRGRGQAPARGSGGYCGGRTERVDAGIVRRSRRRSCAIESAAPARAAWGNQRQVVFREQFSCGKKMGGREERRWALRDTRRAIEAEDGAYTIPRRILNIFLFSLRGEKHPDQPTNQPSPLDN
jgi:hypothetical protein